MAKAVSKNFNNSQFSAYLFYAMAKYDKGSIDTLPEKYHLYFKHPKKMLDFCTKKTFDTQMALLSCMGKKVVLQIHEPDADIIKETKRIAIKYFEKDYDGALDDLINLKIYFVNSSKVALTTSSIADLNNTKSYLNKFDFEKLKLDGYKLKAAAGNLQDRTKLDTIDTINNFSAIIANIFQSFEKPKLLYSLKKEELFVLFLLLSNHNKWLTEDLIKSKLYINTMVGKYMKSALKHLTALAYIRKESFDEIKYQITAKGINVGVKIIEDLTRK